MNILADFWTKLKFAWFEQCFQKKFKKSTIFKGKYAKNHSPLLVVVPLAPRSSRASFLSRPVLLRLETHLKKREKKSQYLFKGHLEKSALLRAPFRERPFESALLRAPFWERPFESALLRAPIRERTLATKKVLKSDYFQGKMWKKISYHSWYLSPVACRSSTMSCFKLTWKKEREKVSSYSKTACESDAFTLLTKVSRYGSPDDWQNDVASFLSQKRERKLLVFLQISLKV